MKKIELGKHDMDILGSYFQMVGYCRATLGLSFNSSEKTPMNPAIQALQTRLRVIVAELDKACSAITDTVDY